MGQAASWWIAATVALAACDQGVSLEVDIGATGATRVELFVASHDPCTACDKVRSPTAAAPLAGTVYFADRDATFDTDVSGGVATFNLQPGAGDNGIRTLVIVGLAGDKVVGATVMPAFEVTNDATRVKISLEAANDDALGGQPPSPDPYRIALWRKQQDDRAGCVAVERWDMGVMSSRQYVVPEADPDCDDVAQDQECRPFEYLTEIRPDETSFTCIDTFPAGSGDACMLGGKTCVDGEGPASTCGPTKFCVPEDVCGAGCTATTPGCLADQLANATAPLAHIDCKLPMILQASGLVTMCDGASIVPVDMGTPFDAGRSCTAARLTSIAAGQAMFGPFVDLRARTSTTADKLRVTAPTAFHASCGFDLTITGSMDPNLSTLELAGIDLALTNDQHILLPVRFVPVRDCTQEARCVASYERTVGGEPDKIVHCIE